MLPVLICVIALFSKNIIVYYSDGTIKHYPTSEVKKITFDVQTVGINSAPNSLSGKLHSVEFLSVGSLFSITYSLFHTSPVSIEVYSVKGRLIQTLTQKVQKNGRHRTTWDCRNTEGQRVSKGNYLIYMNLDGQLIAKSFITL